VTSLIGPLTSTDDNQLLDRSAALARLPSKPRLVYLVAIVWAVAACVWSARTHSFFLYSDARTHLDIARHVTDGLTPGLAQLGSVWLPLPHLLLVPLVASTWMWHSGAAGAIVGGACFVYSAVRVYTLVDELTGNRVGAWCAFAIYATNLNLLYLQTAALTEPVLLAFFIGAIYHLARWMRTRSVRSLALAGLLTFGASLSRYEGWVLLVAAAGLVLVWSRLEPHQVKEPQANVLLYLVLGGYGIVLWIIYNAVIFHNPLYFIESSNSAQSQQHTLANAGQLATKGHLLTSSLTYGWTVIDVVGPIVAGIGLLCIVLLCLGRYPGRRRTLAVLFLLASPIVFNVVALWSGQSALRVPQVAPYGMFNDRYGIMALPIFAVAIGVVAGRWRKTVPALFGVAVLTFVLAVNATPLTVQDGRSGLSSATHGHPEVAAAYLHARYRGGEVLADDSVASPFMFATGLDLKDFITPGFHPYYQNALNSPASKVDWVVSIGRDAIAKDMSAHPERFDRFHLMMSQGIIRVFERETRAT
jgi:Dolichyl-phosphate-mannose-protein mannosyltransferase